MDFDFSPEQKQLKEQVRRYLQDRCDSKAVRAVLDGQQPYDALLWRGLADLGYLGAAIPEAYGGLGAGYLEACVVAEELGRAVAPVPYLSSIALCAEVLLLAGSEAQKQRWLPKLASGQAVGALAVAESAGQPLAGPLRTRAIATPKGVALSGTKLAVLDANIADFAVVLASGCDGVNAGAAGQGQPQGSLYLIDLKSSGVRRTTVETLEPSRGHAHLDFDGAPAEALGPADMGRSLLERVYDRAAVLVAFEQLGGADRALEMGRDYAMQRYAFGRPIGSLQAVKHLLADMYVAATLARSNCYYAAWALSTGAAELPVAAATARVSATQAYQQCSKNNIQVHGGMGFTWEFDCHLYYRRSLQLAMALGSMSVWETKLIERMRAAKLHQTAEV